MGKLAADWPNTMASPTVGFKVSFLPSVLFTYRSVHAIWTGGQKETSFKSQKIYLTGDEKYLK